MDGNTEPLIAVIGHPVAGNPSQFAIERALKSLSLEFRVTSFDVSEDDLATALNGLEVLGFQGVMIDSPLQSRARSWFEKRNPECENSAPIDCLFRDLDRKENKSIEKNTQFSAHDAQSAWLVEAAKSHFQDRDQPIRDMLWLGARADHFPTELEPDNEVMLSTRTPSIESVERANLIVLAPGPKRDVELHASEWPVDDGSTLVVDLTGGHEEVGELLEKGYSVFSHLSRQCGTIQQSLLRWTGQLTPDMIIQEAIEEYLEV